MKIEAPKKASRESAKWEEHMQKKARAPAKGGEAEIIPAKKKHGREAEMKKTVAGKEEHARAHGGARGSGAHEHDGGHAGHARMATGAAVAKPAAAQAKASSDARAKAGEKKDAKAEKQEKTKGPKKSRKVIVKKSGEVSEMSRIALSKISLPTFRGRFGKRNIRRKSKAKWNVWRVPRGTDVKKTMSDGYMPRIGFSRPAGARHVHPSGFREMRVKTESELAGVPTGYAIRVSAGIGSRKKVRLVDMAIEKGIKVLNP